MCSEENAKAGGCTAFPLLLSPLGARMTGREHAHKGPELTTPLRGPPYSCPCRIWGTSTAQPTPWDQHPLRSSALCSNIEYKYCSFCFFFPLDTFLITKIEPDCHPDTCLLASGPIGPPLRAWNSQPPAPGVPSSRCVPGSGWGDAVLLLGCAGLISY